MLILMKILTVGVEFVHAHEQKIRSGDEEVLVPHSFAKGPKRHQSIANKPPYSRNTVLKSVLQ